MSRPLDVLILGAGPAGCAAAITLARHGHHVVQISKPRRAERRLGESIPPSTAKLFKVLGVDASIAAADFLRSTGNTVCWGQGAARVEPFADGQRGWQVTSERLERVMVEAARDTGAIQEVSSVSADAAGARGARFTLDCTGRAGVLARALGLRVADGHSRIVSLAAFWQAPAGFADVAEPTHTVIESYEGGWAWSVPVSFSERIIAFMVEPATSGLRRGASARQVYLAELARAPRLRELAASATLAGSPVGYDASTYRAKRYRDGSVLLVGDAGSFVDPLSSAGVKKALASGWLAGVAVHTSLSEPALRDVALEFFAARETEVHASLTTIARQVLAEAAVGHDQPFWQDRRDAATREETPGLNAALAYVRDQPNIRLARHPQVRTELRPVVRNEQIVLIPHLVTGNGGVGARYAWDVDLLSLVELAPQQPSVYDLFVAYNQRCPPVALPQIVQALSLSIARAYLTQEP